MKRKRIGFNSFYIAIGTTNKNEQTLGLGIGRVRTNEIDYFMVGLVLILIFLNVKVRLPKFMQRK